jgi:hypothetical protein
MHKALYNENLVNSEGVTKAIQVSSKGLKDPMFVDMQHVTGRDNSIFTCEDNKTPFMKAFPSYRQIEK